MTARSSPTPPTQPRWRQFALPGVLLLALALRLFSLADHSLWYDEAFSVLFARNDLPTMLSGTLEAVEHPLLYYVTLNGWMRIFGETALAVRLFSVFTGVAGVYVMYRVGHDLFSRRTGLAAAFVVAIAPFHVQYSQEARMYSLLALLLLLATWAFVRAMRWHIKTDATHKTTAQTTWGWWLSFGALAAAAMHTQQLAAFYLLAIGLVPLILRKNIVPLLASAAFAFAIFAPWLITLPAQLNRFNAQYWISAPSIAQPLFSARIFLGGGLEVDPAASVLLFAGALFMLALLILQIVIYSRKPRRQNTSDRKNLLFVVWLFVAPVVLMWLFSQVAPVYLERALIPSAMMLFLLLGWLFTDSELPRPIAIVVGGVGLLLAGVGLVAQYNLNSFPYSPVHELSAFIAERAEPDSVVIHMNKLSALPAAVYTPQLEHRYLADLPGTPEDTLAPATQAVIGMVADECIQTASAGASSVWFVVYERAITQYAASERTEYADAVAYLFEYFREIERHRFNDIFAWHFVADDAERPTSCPETG